METDYSMTAERGRSYRGHWQTTFLSATKDSSVKNAHIQFTKQSENASGLILFNYVQIIHIRTPHQHLKSFPTIKNIALARAYSGFCSHTLLLFQKLDFVANTGRKKCRNCLHFSPHKSLRPSFIKDLIILLLQKFW